MSDELNLFEVAQTNFDRAAKELDLDSQMSEFLREPMKEIKVSFSVEMDDGTTNTYQGFRIQHNNARGPMKGGIRFHPEETVDTIRALASFMTWKTSVVDIPHGGAKGGVICNPKEMSEKELERLSRSYIDQISDSIGPEKDIPAPDVYTNPQIMAWMMDEYSKIKGFNVPGVITGKPVSLGGSLGRGNATAMGVVYTMREAANRLDMDLKDSTVAIQGYGNAGYNLASLLAERGCDIIAVSDSSGGILEEGGLGPEEVKDRKAETGSVINTPGVNQITNKDLLTLECDFLVPAAIENQITGENADEVKAKAVAEAANSPVTPKADEILHERGVFHIPDVLCNAGGVTVSYFEWVQNIYGYYWSEDRVNERLDKIMTSAFNDVYDLMEKEKVSSRTAAYMIAVDRVAEAVKLRGWI